MDLARYCVDAVLVEGRSVRAVAAATGRSKSWVHRHVALYRAGGDEALAPRKRGPKVPANLTSAVLEDEIVAWRKRLADDGLDAGARTIHWHLSQRRCSGAGSVHHPPGAPASRLRHAPAPEAPALELDALRVGSAQRDLAVRHDPLAPRRRATGRDHQLHRRLLACRAGQRGRAGGHRRRRGADLLRHRGHLWAARLGALDNGAIYTAAYRGSHTGMEIELAALGITFKHGKPYHPQTQGKVERYHLTLKKWLRKKPSAATLAELQAQIDRFVHIYNEERPHTARGCPPMQAWRALDKATVEIDGQPLLAHTKVRRDRIDKTGCVHLALSVQAPPHRRRPGAHGQARARS